MKKNILTLAVFGFFVMLAGSAFAGTKAIVYGTATSIGGASFNASKGVTIQADTSTTTYRVASKNLNGDKIYKATSVNPSVVESAGVIGTACASSDLPTL